VEELVLSMRWSRGSTLRLSRFHFIIFKNINIIYIVKRRVKGD